MERGLTQAIKYQVLSANYAFAAWQFMRMVEARRAIYPAGDNILADYLTCAVICQKEARYFYDAAKGEIYGYDFETHG